MDVIIFHVSLSDAGPLSHTLTISTIHNRKKKRKGKKKHFYQFSKITPSLSFWQAILYKNSARSQMQIKIELQKTLAIITSIMRHENANIFKWNVILLALPSHMIYRKN